MVPEFDVESYVSYRPSRLRVLTADEVVNGFVHNIEYEPLPIVTWDEVANTLDVERGALDVARSAQDAASYESALDEVEDAGTDDDLFLAAVGGLDLGVAGLVMALAAAGGATFTSCRGQAPGSIHQHPHPFVGVALDAPRAALLAEMVGSEGCCLYEVELGLLAVGAPTLERAHALASRILERRHDFDSLPLPLWKAALTATGR